MFDAARLALSQILSPPFRAIMWKAVGLTVLLLVGIWFAVQGLLAAFLVLPMPWMETAVSIVSGLGMVVGLAFFVAPATALFAGLFLDEVAAMVEADSYPRDAPGRPQSIVSGLLSTIRFFGVVVLVNLVALPLVLLLGSGFVIFFVANAYLLGREYFQMAALRFHDAVTVDMLRERNSVGIFFSGLLIAGFMAIPIVNLLTPLFATAFMVRRYKHIAAREAATGGLAASAA